jgi:hypothetical protein
LKKLVFISILLLAGCLSDERGSVISHSVTMYPDGVVKTTDIEMKSPSSPSGPSLITDTTDGVSITVSAQQSKAKLAKAEGSVKNKKYLYIACGIFLLLGGIAIAMPDYIIGSIDSFLVMGSAMASTALVFYVDASVKIMGYLIPVLIVVGVSFIYMKHTKAKNKGSNNE